MASVKGGNITNIDASPITKVSSEEAGGKLRVWHDTYEASSLASGSDITMARIPAGATIHDVIVKADALGSSVGLQVGDSDDDDRYWAAKGSWNVAGQTHSMLAGQSIAAGDSAAMTGIAHRVTSETDILITTSGASATGTIDLWVYYTVE